MKIRVFFATLTACCITAAVAQIVSTMPYTLQNGTVADANQVMANFNSIKNDTNTNAATAGVNTNITALNGLTTPISYTVGGSSHYLGGTSSGSANAQAVLSPTPTGFALTTGLSVTFTAGFTNSGPMTLDVAATGAKNVFGQGISGPAALVGGEVVTGNMITVIYDGTRYQVLGTSPSSLVPAGTIADFGGVAIPAGWLAANGAAVSRTTYAALFAVNSYSVAATTTSTSTSVVVPNSALFSTGWSVGGNNVTCNVTITGIPDGTHITISAAAGTSGATTLTIGPYQQGDCSTTFNLPNFIGRIAAGVDGTSRITATTCTNSASLGTYCGAQTNTLLTANLPQHRHGVVFTDDGHTHNYSADLALSNGPTGGGGVPGPPASNATGSNNSAVGRVQDGSGNYNLTAITGSDTPHAILNPVGLVYKIVKF